MGRIAMRIVLLLSAATWSAGDEVRVVVVDGPPLAGRLAQIGASVVVDVDGTPRRLAWDDLVALEWRAAEAPIASDDGGSPPGHWFALADGTRVAARVVTADELIALHCRGDRRLRIKPGAVRAIVACDAPAEALAEFAAAGAEADDLDLALVARGDQPLRLLGVIRGIGPAGVEFAWRGRDVTLPWPRVVGIAPGRSEEFSTPQRVQLRNGDVLAGTIVGGNAVSLELDSPTLGAQRVSFGEVARITCDSRRVTPLATLVVAEYEHDRLFGRAWSPAIDRTLFGEPIVLGGRRFARGLCLHSQCRISFDIDGRFARFETLAGIADQTDGRGSVVLRVIGDERLLWESPVILGGAAPLEVAVDVVNVKRLTLAVDEADELDIGDHLCLGAARLIRPAE